ncbi:hypothetical protein LQZ21_09135 [Treponema sp. TIM-1]|uniref:hypothetical protein n=1 Tax=Treponema sp. TIM-1 TaxID=2898417 RepID=UPI003980081C
MANSRKARAILVLALVLGVTALGFSFDIKSFPSPIQKGSILISGGFGLGLFYPAIAGAENSALVGGSVAVDYALPINFALTVGGEIGYSGSKLKSWGNNSDASLGEIPIIARVAWHPNWEVNNLDTYVLVKFGYGIGFWGGDDLDGLSNPHGVIFGTNLGFRYFFLPAFGAFLETGYEYHFLRFKTDFGGWTTTWSAFGAKFLTLGVTLRL